MDYKTYILCALRKCVKEQLQEPELGLRNDHFAYRSYQLWAAEEVLKFVENYERDPEDAIEIFISKMNEHACRNNKTGMMFSIASDVGVWLLDILIAMEDK